MSTVCLTQRSYQQQNHYQLLLLQQQQQHLQLIAPAAQKTKILGNSNLQNVQPSSSAMLVLPKKKYTYSAMPFGQQPLASVERRNQRERNRVKQVNNGYSNLRQHIPQTVINTLSNGGRGASKKLSKVDTLRIAVEYIRGLQQLLDKSESSASNSTRNVRTVYDDASNDSSNYDFVTSNDDVQRFHQPAHSEAPTSPASSYGDSDLSTGGLHYYQPLKFENEPEQQQQQQQQQQHQHETEFKFATDIQNYELMPMDNDIDRYENHKNQEVLNLISMLQQE